MGKIYDALKRAEEEAKNNRRRKSIESETSANLILSSETIGNRMPAAQEPQKTFIRSDKKEVPPLKLIPQAHVPLRKKDLLISLLNILSGKGNGVPPVSTDVLVTLREPRSFVAEQYRILKSRLLSACNDSAMRTILITSALEGEGKSTVSSNLAISIAQTMNEHALLMDCDLRRPTIHKLFNLANKAGLSNYLSGDIPLCQALEKTKVDRLTVLPAGTILDNPSELLSSRKMTDLLEELKHKYDDRYILLDATPIQQTPEPAILAKQIDCIIFVVKAGNTDRELIKRSLDSLVKKKVVGVVFNMAQESTQSHYYNYYSSYSEENR
jgi:exopolysaccharide/PEP-CTERM locus tyrosine autokinase